MFLDPEPRTSRSRPQSSKSSPPTPSLPSPVHLPQDQRIRRKPLQERSKSQANRQREVAQDPQSALKPTVRLIRPSPSIASLRKDGHAENAGSAVKDESHRRRDRLTILKTGVRSPESGVPGLSDARVSDAQPPANDEQSLSSSQTASVIPTTSTLPEPLSWHRRHASSGNDSTSSTLKGSEAANASSLLDDYDRSERIASGTTLRGTPAPYEKELGDQSESAEESAWEAQTLQRLDDISLERPTVTSISPPPESFDDGLGHPFTARPASIRRQTWSSSSDSDRVVHRRIASSSGVPDIAPHFSSERSPSLTFSDPPVHDQTPNGSPASPTSPESQHTYRRQSFAESEASIPDRTPVASSPNFISFHSDPTRPRSRSHLLRGEASYESIQSRLEASFARPETQHSLAQSSSWSSLRPTSSIDTLPSIHVPKRRQTHKKGSLSLDSGMGSRDHGSGSMDPEAADTLPYPRQPFSGHLSTIASESERSHSRSASQQLSHFSFGSGVLTGDDASSLPLSGTWYSLRPESQPLRSPSFDLEQSPSKSNEDGLSDMRLGLYRQHSAKPDPLFRTRSSGTPARNRLFDGSSPPLLPTPGSEHLDVLAELGAPNLKQMRSGQSLKHQRSNSSIVPGTRISQASYHESERWSTGSNIFPAWARQFYGGTAVLASMSKTSLSSLRTLPTRDSAQNAVRDEPQRAQPPDEIVTSRPGSSPGEPESGSPASSRFLPAVFRPRTRLDVASGGADSSSLNRKSHRSSPEEVTDRHSDPLAIQADPLPAEQDDSILPSGQPKYGILRDHSPGGRSALPRNYSEQRDWDGMTFPRPMSKDRVPDFDLDPPHLAPTKRSSDQLSPWRPPSFVESLDTLFKERGNRQVLFFILGFLCPLCWMLGAVMPLPARPPRESEAEKPLAQSDENLDAVLGRHEAGDAAARWRAEKAWYKGRWWRTVNRIMSVLGAIILAAVVSLVSDDADEDDGYAIRSADKDHRLRLPLSRRAELPSKCPSSSCPPFSLLIPF